VNTSATTRNRLIRAAIIGLAGALLAVAISFIPGFLDGFERRTWDLRVKTFAAPGEATDDVALIFIDQKSLDWAEEAYQLSWPWPREVYSYIINFCDRAGVESLAFDVLYTEASVYGVYDDEALAMSVAGMGRFVAALFLGNETGQSTDWIPEAPEPSLNVEGQSALLEYDDAVFERAAFPIPELLATAHSLANVSAVPDDDGVFRRARLFAEFGGKVVPALSLASYTTAYPEQQSLAIEKRRIIYGDQTIHTDSEGRVIINYRGPSGTHVSYTASAIIQSEANLLAGEVPPIDPEALKGKHVLFGFSAPGLLDLRPSAVAPVYTGVEIHATVLDNLLSGDFIRDFPDVPYRLVLALLVFLCGAAATLTSGGTKNILAYILFLIIPVALGIILYFGDYWMPIMEPEIAVLITLIGAGVANFVTEGRQKRFIKGAFSQYLSPTVIEQLIENPENLKLGGERRELSIFFSDLEGFTSISEALTPESLTSLLNDYLSAMTDIILEEGGTIDKYEGDAIIAFWNAPIDQPDHAKRLVFAALRCQGKLAEMQPDFRMRTGSELLMRIGINTGPAVVGNLGSRDRFDYSMLGDAVNLAARLEGINKQFRSYTLISQSTYKAIEGSVPAREMSRVAVVGRKEPVTVYEPMLQAEYEQKKTILDGFDQGLREYYAGNFPEAERIFAQIEKDDPPSAAYRERCKKLIANPPSTWRGVWVMTSK
jgi:adenylate cyclase